MSVTVPTDLVGVADGVSLLRAEWSSVVGRVPRDGALHERPCPEILRPRVPVPVYRVPVAGEAPVAELPVEHVPGWPSWVPVVDARPGWAQVLLACRPDGAVGWVRVDGRVERVRHACHIEVDTRMRSLALVRMGKRRCWPAGVGRGASPTPRGRTVVMGHAEPRGGLVRFVLVLAAHMRTHLEYGLGMAAVNIHAAPGPASARRPADSDGSIVVPPAAMTVLAACARPGTAVLIR